MNVLPVYNDRYIKTKIRTYGDKLYTNLCGLNLPEDGVKFDSFTIIFIDFLLVYENNYFLQVCLHNCAYKILDKQMIVLMTIFLGLMKIRFLTLINRSYKFCIIIKLI